MKQFVHGHTAHKFKVVPFFCGKLEKTILYILKAGTISRTQIF